MSSAGISFGGLASGLDTRAIIDALVAIERRPITALEQKKTALGRQKSLFGDLRGLLDRLSTAAKALKTTTDFLQMKAASDDEDVLTATASSSATPGTHAFRVMALATAQVNSSNGSASASASLGGTGELMLHVGGNDIPIAVNAPTLESIAAAINTADHELDTGVRADVIDTGNTANGGAQRYQLVVRSTTTGAEGAFQLEYVDGAAAFQTVIQEVAANVRTPGQDAAIQLFSGTGTNPTGITVYRSSNTIGDLIPGVTIDLKSADPTKNVTVAITTDAEATAKKVQDFVDAYNKVVDFFAEQNALDAEGKAKNPLFGDPTLRSMRSSLRSIVGGSVAGTGNEAFQLLSQVGVTSDKDGKLTFNRGKFDEALANDETAVAAVFTQASNGIARRLIDQLDVYTDSVDGLIKNRNDTFDRQVKQTQSRIDQAERRLTMYEKQLETKYANLENLLAKLQGQGASVASVLNSLNRPPS